MSKKAIIAIVVVAALAVGIGLLVWSSQARASDSGVRLPEEPESNPEGGAQET